MPEIEHHEEHFKANQTIRDIIIGMSDGLTVPFALAAGLSGAVEYSSIIVIAGLAEIVAGSISMGLGGYLAAQNDADHYYNERKREYREVLDVPEKERQEVVDVFKQYGLEEKEIEPVLNHFEKDHEAWVNFMMQNELHLDEPHPNRMFYSAGTIAISYIVGGIIPLSPYFFISAPHQALFVSIFITLVALTIFGFVKSRFVGINPWKGALQTAIIGSIAAGAAYLIASLVG